ncbi:MAG: NifU family protein [Chitinophagales bacterium]|jgi:Fe-S cluster biogenesis protein NfuA|nr:NifU family protein [Bacteroidota bacterium]MBP8249119.1 NifU family protein [Chitinophagales bacterium]MBK9505025.1 NifU family protein [Bacteroidota bacterium]MBK9556028.1 NifU family protein [Bacteroidota bacterium]MBL0279201.1 NifU family protein [Bacteroidota bacterium]
MSNFIVSIYTEATPNPDSLKFVMNKMLLTGRSVDFERGDEVAFAPLAEAIFNEYSYVKGVFIMNNFVTVRKDGDIDWFEVKSTISDFIKNWVSEGKVIVGEIPETDNISGEMDGDAVVAKIKAMLDQYVKPAVEMDGGAIQFKSFDNGIVTLMMQGSCSGCPSSTVTLKSGIEGLLRRMVPEVKEVVAESVEM